MAWDSTGTRWALGVLAAAGAALVAAKLRAEASQQPRHVIHHYPDLPPPAPSSSDELGAVDLRDHVIGWA